MTRNVRACAHTQHCSLVAVVVATVPEKKKKKKRYLYISRYETRRCHYVSRIRKINVHGTARTELEQIKPELHSNGQDDLTDGLSPHSNVQRVTADRWIRMDRIGSHRFSYIIFLFISNIRVVKRDRIRPEGYTTYMDRIYLYGRKKRIRRKKRDIWIGRLDHRFCPICIHLCRYRNRCEALFPM